MCLMTCDYGIYITFWAKYGVISLLHVSIRDYRVYQEHMMTSSMMIVIIDNDCHHALVRKIHSNFINYLL